MNGINKTAEAHLAAVRALLRFAARNEIDNPSFAQIAGAEAAARLDQAIATEKGKS